MTVDVDVQRLVHRIAQDTLMELAESNDCASRFERYLSEILDQADVKASAFLSATAYTYCAEAQLNRGKPGLAADTLDKARDTLIHEPPHLSILILLRRAAELYSLLGMTPTAQDVLDYIERCLRANASSAFLDELPQTQALRYQFQDQQHHRDRLLVEIRELTGL